jgi:hypothetical protein
MTKQGKQGEKEEQLRNGRDSECGRIQLDPLLNISWAGSDYHTLLEGSYSKLVSREGPAEGRNKTACLGSVGSSNAR